MVVTDSKSLPAALALDAQALIIHSKRRRRNLLEGADWRVKRYLQMTGDVGPIIIATPTRAVLRYLAVEWSPPATIVQAIARLGLRSVTATKSHNLTVATRETGLPQALAAGSAAAGLALPNSFFMFFGSGNDRQRPVAFAFPGSGQYPDWLVKWSRMDSEPERGKHERDVRAAVARYPDVGEHVPRDLGRLSLGGAPASVETVAPGISLDGLWQRGDADKALSVGERVLEWLCDLAQASATPGCDPRALVVDDTGALGVDTNALIDTIANVPRVIAHNDLGTVNVLTDGSRFAVIDWEDGLIEGLPVVDVAYFVTTLLAMIHAPSDTRERARWCCALWRGDLPQSQFAFRWLRQAADRLGLDGAQAGALVTMSWLRGAHSDGDREYLRTEQTPDLGYYRGFVTEYWLRDERLGLGWQFDETSG
ncbi:MAG: hypothetical protein ACOYD0_06465 [Candidatus Nanopelagicales bacterium]